MFDFDDDALDTMVPAQEPVLVCFYSGGFFHADGRKLMNDLLEVAASKGIGDTLVLGFPDYYGLTGEGYEWWPKYVDILVEEIENEGYGDRPLLLFGHSRGTCPCMSLATRLGSRVLKVYTCGGGPIVAGEPSAWEKMSKAFKQGGDKALLTWFASLNPGNVILERAASLKPEEIPNALKESTWLDKMVSLMKTQYMDATFPQMIGENADIRTVSVPIMAFQLEYDAADKDEHFVKHLFPTTADVEIIKIKKGHMDCIGKGSELLEIAAADMAKFLPESERTL